MKFTVHREAMGSSLALLTGATSTSAPNLESVLLSADSQRNVVTAVTTNLHLRMSTTIPATVTGVGRLAIRASKLLAMIRATPSEQVHVAPTQSDSTLKLTGGAVVFEVPGIAAREFPRPFEIEPELQITVDQNKLIEVLEQVSCCQSSDPNRIILNATRITIEQKGARATLTATATNARVLARSTCEVEVLTPPRPDCSVFRYTIPRDTINEMVRAGHKLVDDFRSTVTFGKKHVSLTLRAEGPSNTTRDIEISSVLVDADYPDKNVLTIIDKVATTYASLSVDVLKETLERILLVCCDEQPFVSISFNQEGAVFTSRSDLGSAKDLLQYSDGTTFTAPVSITLNPRFLLAMIRPFAGSTLRIFTTKSHPGAAPQMAQLKVDEHPGYRGVIVPIRTEAEAVKAAA